MAKCLSSGNVKYKKSAGGITIITSCLQRVYKKIVIWRFTISYRIRTYNTSERFLSCGVPLKVEEINSDKVSPEERRYLQSAALLFRHLFLLFLNQSRRQ
jgi:hypothetical protein